MCEATFLVHGRQQAQPMIALREQGVRLQALRGFARRSAAAPAESAIVSVGEPQPAIIAS